MDLFGPRVYLLCIILSAAHPSANSSIPAKQVPPQLDELEVTTWNLKFITY
jgi:hypothetical protein